MQLTATEISGLVTELRVLFTSEQGEQFGKDLTFLLNRVGCLVKPVVDGVFGYLRESHMTRLRGYRDEFGLGKDELFRIILEEKANQGKAWDMAIASIKAGTTK